MTTCALVLLAAFGAAEDYDGAVLDFTATWCGPCQQMSPLVSKLERQGYPIRKVDVDQNRELTKQFNITSIPTFVLVVANREVSRVTGPVSEQSLKEMLGKIPGRPATIPVDNPAPANARDSGAERKGTASRREQPTTSRDMEIAQTDPPAKKKGFEIPFFPKKEAPAKPRDSAPLVARGKKADEPPLAEKPVEGSPLAAAVRIRVSDGKGEDFGTGTIVDSRVGRSLVLTCGHMFRNWSKQSLIQVDLFRGDKTETFVGTRIDHDAESDVGLVAINTEAILPICHVAAPGVKVLKGTRVISVGCGGGERPTVEEHKVTALNRYLGPDNLECSGVPVQGRSGGGLFTADGTLIGVCNAADPHHKEGLYAGLRPVHDLLDRCKLSHIYRVARPVENPAVAAGPLVDEGSSPAVAPMSDRFGSEEFAAEIGEGKSLNATNTPARISQELAFDPDAIKGPEGDVIREALQQVEGSEVICIVRPIDQPRGASRVIVINRASDRFLKYLTGEVRTQSAIQKTTLSQPNTDGEITFTRYQVGEEIPEKTAPQAYRRTRRVAATAD